MTMKKNKLPQISYEVIKNNKYNPEEEFKNYGELIKYEAIDFEITTKQEYSDDIFELDKKYNYPNRIEKHIFETNEEYLLNTFYVKFFIKSFNKFLDEIKEIFSYRLLDNLFESEIKYKFIEILKFNDVIIQNILNSHNIFYEHISFKFYITIFKDTKEIIITPIMIFKPEHIDGYYKDMERL